MPKLSDYYVNVHAGGGNLNDKALQEWESHQSL